MKRIRIGRQRDQNYGQERRMDGVSPPRVWLGLDFRLGPGGLALVALHLTVYNIPREVWALARRRHSCGPSRMMRVCGAEILDAGDTPEPVVARAYRDLTRLHRWLGDTAVLARAIRRDPLPVRRILDVGCGHGGVLAQLERRLGVDGVGVDLRPPADAPVRMVRADVVRDPLPPADVAYSLCLAHHLSDDEVIAMIQNVGRSCRRFLLMDLVRHPLPLVLFRTFVAPFFSPVAVADGMMSIRRSYTPEEFVRIARRAGAQYRHSVSPIYANQMLDIVYD